MLKFHTSLPLKVARLKSRSFWLFFVFAPGGLCRTSRDHLSSVEGLRRCRGASRRAGRRSLGVPQLLGVLRHQVRGRVGLQVARQARAAGVVRGRRARHRAHAAHAAHSAYATAGTYK